MTKEYPIVGTYEFEAWAKEQLDFIHDSYKEQIGRFNDLLETITREEIDYDQARRARYGHLTSINNAENAPQTGGL